MDGFKKEIREERAGAGYHALRMPAPKFPISFRPGGFNGPMLVWERNVVPLFPLGDFRNHITQFPLTVSFEFFMGLVLAHRSLAHVLHDYNLLEGRVWVLFLIWLTLAPWAFNRIRGPG